VEYLLRRRGCGLSENGLISPDRCCLRGVEVLSQVDQVGARVDHLQNLRLTVNHVLVLEDLLDSNWLASSLIFRLKKSVSSI
jgi:hypothetical protein